MTSDVTWKDAEAAAAEVPNGTLVNIETSDEMTAITKQIESLGLKDDAFWIGATRTSDSKDYYWVDGYGMSQGDPISTSNSNWLKGEPSYKDANTKADEMYVVMLYSSKEGRWVWNDTPNDLVKALSYYKGKMAYIIESLQ